MMGKQRRHALSCAMRVTVAAFYRALLHWRDAPLPLFSGAHS